MPKRLALTVLLLAGIPALASALPGNIYYGRLDFTGSSTVGTNLYIQLRDVGGSTACATTAGVFLPASTSAAAARDSVALGWRIIGGGGSCFSGTSRCRSASFAGTPALGFDVDGAGFTVFASTNGSTWTQVTIGSPYSFGSGLQMGVGADTGSNVPTLTEWGLILLAAIVGWAGLAAVRRRAAAVPV